MPPSDAETGVGVDGQNVLAAYNVADTGSGAETQGFSVAEVSPTQGTAPYGDFPHAESPYGGGSLASASEPTVTVVAPTGTLTGGGPTVTVSWLYHQAEGRAQTSAVVTVTDTTTATVVYTKTVTGAASSLTFNALTAGLNPNTTGGRYQTAVTVYAGDPHLTATAFGNFDLSWGVPTVTILQPPTGGALTAPSTQIGWQYSDSGGDAQQTFNVTVHDAAGRLVASGGTVASTAQQTLLFFYPLDQKAYTLTVTVTNVNGVVGTASAAVIGVNPATSATPGAPGLSDKTLRWYNRLPAYMRDADMAQPGQPLLSYMALIGEQFGAAEGLYDRIDFVSPDAGGPPPGSGLPHARSDLVSPLSADDDWLPWLGNVLGVPQADRTLPQWRVAMIPRPDPGGSLAYLSSPVTTDYGAEAGPPGGPTERVPLLLTPYASGSKGGIKQAVQDLYAEAVQPATVVEGTTIVNAGYAAQPVVARRVGSQWVSPDSSALIISTAAGYEFVAENGSVHVVADQSDAGTVTSFQAGASYTFEVRLTAPTTVPATMTVTLTGTTTTATGTVTLNAGATGTVFAVTVVAPVSVEDVRVDLVVTGMTSGQAVNADQIAVYAPVFTNLQVGADVYGLGLQAGTTIVAVLGPVTVQLSKPAEFTVAAGLIVVVPRVPVLVTDHWLGDPWTVNVAVPFGTDPVALEATLAAQQPSGVTFTVTYGVLTWETLYTTYGDGSSATWTGVEGTGTTPRTWGDIERQLTT